MGVHGLTKLLTEHAPAALKKEKFSSYFGRTVAIDASMSIYQFLIAVRSEGMNLTNDAGENTSHLQGFFYRTIRMVENGIKPIYVFDGKPPASKSDELLKRAGRRAEAEAGHAAAKEAGDAAEMEKFSRRTVRVTKEHNEEVRKLLKLMGIPVMIAPCEAEAQCARIVKDGKAFAAATEDMDTITHGAPILLRHLTFAEARKQDIVEIHHEAVLTGLDMTQEQFVDLCILLGCDYAASIKGIGPSSALNLIRKHGSMEKIIEHLTSAGKYTIPPDWSWEEARRLFLSAEVSDTKDVQFTWDKPDEEGLVEFLCKQKGFSEDRVKSGCAKLIKSKGKSAQGRMDSFFTKVPTNTITKKKAEPLTKTAPAKKARPNTYKGK